MITDVGEYTGVSMPHAPKTPKLLHKYMAVSGERRQWLEDLVTQSRFYFPSVADFNDPFDCHPNFHVSDQESWVRKMVTQELAHESLEKIEREIAKILKAQIWHKPETLVRYRKAFLENVQYPLGVFSLSEELHSILMWSHYAEKHTGLCLTFDGHSEFFARAMKVSYQKAFPVVDLARPHEEIVHAALLVKSDEWEYEKEWRIIDENNGRTGRYQFPKENLVEVTFGARMAPVEQSDLQSLFETNFPHIKFFRMFVDTTDFRLDRISI